MTEIASEQAIAKHRIPVIDRMMDVLFLLEKRAGGATIRDLVDRLGLPRTTADSHDFDLATLSKPHLERLAQETGEACKVSVRDGDSVLVVAGVQGTREYA